MNDLVRPLELEDVLAKAVQVGALRSTHRTIRRGLWLAILGVLEQRANW